MAKKSALGAAFLIDGVDISGDVQQVTLRDSSGVLDVTAISASAMERILGLADGEISVVTYFNDATDREHLTLRGKSSGADRIATFLEGATIGNMAAGIVAKQVNYDTTRGQDASLTSAIQCLSDGSGLEYCEQLTAGLRTDTTGTNGASQNNGAATALGLSAYLHVTSITGTSVTVTIQESSDDGGSDAYANVSGGAFAAASAAGAQRIVTAVQAVEQYLRAVSSGTFNPATFSVSVCRTPIR